jgi:hypothetical protein
MDEAGIAVGAKELIKAIKFGSLSELENPHLTREQILSIMFDEEDDEED